MGASCSSIKHNTLDPQKVERGNTQTSPHWSLEELKQHKFLTNRIFQNISENMHYEIFKNLNDSELLQIRELNRAGYQLTSNRLLRSRIGFPYLIPIINFVEDMDVEDNVAKIKLLFEQSENEILDFSKINLFKDNKLVQLINLFKFIPQLKGLNFGKKRIWDGRSTIDGMYADINNNDGVITLAENLSLIPNLEYLNLSR